MSSEIIHNKLLLLSYLESYHLTTALFPRPHPAFCCLHSSLQVHGQGPVPLFLTNDSLSSPPLHRPGSLHYTLVWTGSEVLNSWNYPIVTVSTVVHSGSRRFCRFETPRTHVKLPHGPGSPLSDVKMEQEKKLANGSENHQKRMLYTLKVQTKHFYTAMKSMTNNPIKSSWQPHSN